MNNDFIHGAGLLKWTRESCFKDILKILNILLCDMSYLYLVLRIQTSWIGQERKFCLRHDAIVLKTYGK